MKIYLDLVEKVLTNGLKKQNRTGKSALTVAGAMLEHDMFLGFPAITTKRLAFKTMLVELEGFIKGITDKSWYKSRGCNIWNEWANPNLIDVAEDGDRRIMQEQENDLGPIYGYQWRNFGGFSSEKKGFDQLKNVVETLKKDPNNRRMLVSAWNPIDMPFMALPPCHVLFHLTVIDSQLNMVWFQRSCDVMLGIPFNLASYATLLHLLSLESGLKPGKIIGMLSDVHIYEDHIEGAKQQLKRYPHSLPNIVTKDFTSIFSWEYTQTNLENYTHDSKISFEVAV